MTLTPHSSIVASSSGMSNVIPTTAAKLSVATVADGIVTDPLLRPDWNHMAPELESVGEDDVNTEVRVKPFAVLVVGAVL